MREHLDRGVAVGRQFRVQPNPTCIHPGTAPPATGVTHGTHSPAGGRARPRSNEPVKPRRQRHLKAGFYPSDLAVYCSPQGCGREQQARRH